MKLKDRWYTFVVLINVSDGRRLIMEDKNSDDLFFNQYTEELDHLNKLFKNTDQFEQKNNYSSYK
jgi:hypothetical protein